MIKQSLTPELLVAAYSQGYFPMANMRTGKVSWYFPDPRAIIPLEKFHRSRSLKKVIESGKFKISYDKDFTSVMKACANRKEGNWISEEFFIVYSKLHEVGKAHSVEVWEGKKLVGGVYGVALGSAFFGESMFHTSTNASKVALHYLVEKLKEGNFELFEVQYLTPHLESLGAIEISAAEYLVSLGRALKKQGNFTV